ncbi:MAG: YqaJ viral recombinase family protein [Bifidobacterium bifidum]
MRSNCAAASASSTRKFQVIDGTDISLVSDAHPVMHASLDGFIYDEASDSWGILEIKTANANRGRTDWHNDEGELIAPDYYMAQVTHYMAVTGFRWGYFYADIGEAEPVEVRFERDEDDVDAIIHAAEDFWGFVARDEMPALTGADVAKAYPEPAEGHRGHERRRRPATAHDLIPGRERPTRRHSSSVSRNCRTASSCTSATTRGCAAGPCRPPTSTRPARATRASCSHGRVAASDSAK